MTHTPDTSAQHEQRLLRWFTNPASYPHPVEHVKRRETHVSHVFLAGSFVYKLKKTVRFPFLDASTLARRKRWCRLEVTLNRRLAPQLYIATVPVVETRWGLQLGGHGTIIEWVVKMHRLPEERMLDHVLVARRVSRHDVEDIADQLVGFFIKAARSRVIDRYGTPAHVAALVLDNLSECKPFAGRVLTQRDWEFLDAAFRQFVALQEPLLAQRVREGRIVDGHGDLRCENICLATPTTIFDCVEFEPAFRCGDMANDLSFLVMDLEFRGRTDLARVLVNRYQRAMHDTTLARVLPFYKCHRSLVRGKVRALAWRQHPATREGRRLRELSRQHFALARRYAEQWSRPRLIVVSGLIGTGKSTVAKWLAKALGATWLRTDEIRRRAFAHHRRSRQGFAEGLYAPSVSTQVYHRLLEEAERCVRQQRSVVCDGTFSQAAGRNQLRRIAARHGASFHLVECVTPRAVALRRLARRAARGTDLSEAKPAYYDRMKRDFEPIRGWPSSAWTRLSTVGSPHRMFQKALAALRKAWRHD